MSPSLSLAADNTRPTPAASLADRIARLQADLRTLNAEQVADLESAIATTLSLAADVAANPTQAPGIRDVARRLAEDLDTRAITMAGIVGRAGR